jgi:hypothetical protein
MGDRGDAMTDPIEILESLVKQFGDDEDKAALDSIKTRLEKLSEPGQG